VQPSVDLNAAPPLGAPARALPPDLTPLLGPHTREVAVLGAGLMGRLMAWTLARAGLPVSLYEAGGPQAEGAAARVAAAMLAPLAESAVADLSVVRMGQYALGRWPELLAGLSQPVFFQREGTLIVWHRQDRQEAQRFEHWLQGTSRQEPSLPSARPLDADHLAALEPALAGRFSLVGVVADGHRWGAALIAVDGKPARPYRVGAVIEDGVTLLAVEQRRAVLGPSREAPPSLVLDLPALKP